MNFFSKHKTNIFRALGILMFLIALVVHFWRIPQEGLTENEMAAINVARMEAKVSGKSVGTEKPTTFDSSILKENQEKQLEYLTILAMIFGLGFLGYSFIQKG